MQNVIIMSLCDGIECMDFCTGTEIAHNSVSDTSTKRLMIPLIHEDQSLPNTL
jgi:hypothetical protein